MACNRQCPPGTKADGANCRSATAPISGVSDSATAASGSGGSTSAVRSVQTPSGSGVGGAIVSVATGGQAGTSSAGQGSRSSATTADPCQASPSRSICDGSTMLHCGPQGTTETRSECSNATFCTLGLAAGTCATCAPATYRCTGASLEQCGSDGQFAPVRTCDSAALCNVAAGDCTTQKCKSNSKVCDPDGTLWTCDASGTSLMDPQVCGSGMCDQNRGQCNVCVPSSRMCAGEQVLTCSADGMTQQPMDCPATNCNVADCVAGTCVNNAAPAGTKCNSGVCDANGACVGCLSASDCRSDELCVASKCTPKTCTPNAAVCTSSGTLQICDATGAAIAASKACGPGLCNANGRSCYNCAPNARSCDGDSLVTCSADGSQTTKMQCPSRNDGCTTATCIGGACMENGCPLGQSCIESTCSAPLPNGTYMMSCGGCTSDGVILSCKHCDDGLGATAPSSVSYLTCVDGVANCHAHLTCQTSSVPGTWTQSCSQVKFDGCILDAMCEDGTGNRVAAHYDISLQPCSNVTNCKGMLQCNAC